MAGAPIQSTIHLAPKLGSIQAQLLLRDRYETSYGIFNHDAESDRPMALVAMHPCEDAVSGSLLYERMEQFADKQVTKWFGLSWAEFIQQSPDLCLKQLEICSKLNAKTDSETEKTLNQLREASR